MSKVVVERLKEYIPTFMSPFQTGFASGRMMHEKYCGRRVNISHYPIMTITILKFCMEGI